MALKTANKIAAVNCPGISTPLKPPTLLAPVVDSVPDIQVSPPEARATESGTLLPVLISEVQPARGRGREHCLSVVWVGGRGNTRAVSAS